jgi:hypothetical protein
MQPASLPVVTNLKETPERKDRQDYRLSTVLTKGPLQALLGHFEISGSRR